jgi:hypothetical protein
MPFPMHQRCAKHYTSCTAQVAIPESVTHEMRRAARARHASAEAPSTASVWGQQHSIQAEEAEDSNGGAAKPPGCIRLVAAMPRALLRTKAVRYTVSVRAYLSSLVCRQPLHAGSCHASNGLA